MLNLYVQDHSYRGMLVVAAMSEAEARELMKQSLTYHPDDDIECIPVTQGLCLFNYGDA